MMAAVSDGAPPSRLLLTGAALLAAFVVVFGAYGWFAVRGRGATVVSTGDGRSVEIGVAWPGALDHCVTDHARTVLPNCYREDVNSTSFVKQPAATASAFAFCIVGLLILGHADGAGRRGGGGPMTRQEEAWLGFVALAMGPGSALFHGTLTVWGGWFDEMSMYALLAFIVAFDVVRLRRTRDRFPAWFWSAFALAAALKLATGDKSTYVFIAAAIGVGTFTLVSWSTLLRRADLERDGIRLGLAFAVLGASIVPWLLSNPLSGDPTVVPYHSAWHILAAGFVLAYWWYLQSERAADDGPIAGTVTTDVAAPHARL